jgi:hypothetical protein
MENCEAKSILTLFYYYNPYFWRFKISSLGRNDPGGSKGCSQKIQRSRTFMEGPEIHRTLTEVLEDLRNIIEDHERSRMSIEVPRDPNMLKIKSLKISQNWTSLRRSHVVRFPTT